MFNQLSRRELKQLLAVAVALCLLLIAWIFFSPINGAYHYFRLQSDIDTIARQNLVLSEQNEGLRAEIDKLTNDPAYLEKTARTEYGLLKKNEIVYDFGKKK